MANPGQFEDTYGDYYYYEDPLMAAESVVGANAGSSGNNEYQRQQLQLMRKQLKKKLLEQLDRREKLLEERRRRDKVVSDQEDMFKLQQLINQKQQLKNIYSQKNHDTKQQQHDIKKHYDKEKVGDADHVDEQLEKLKSRLSSHKNGQFFPTVLPTLPTIQDPYKISMNSFMNGGSPFTIDHIPTSMLPTAATKTTTTPTAMTTTTAADMSVVPKNRDRGLSFVKSTAATTTAADMTAVSNTEDGAFTMIRSRSGDAPPTDAGDYQDYYGDYDPTAQLTAVTDFKKTSASTSSSSKASRLKILKRKKQLLKALKNRRTLAINSELTGFDKDNLEKLGFNELAKDYEVSEKFGTKGFSSDYGFGGGSSGYGSGKPSFDDGYGAPLAKPIGGGGGGDYYYKGLGGNVLESFKDGYGHDTVYLVDDHDSDPYVEHDDHGHTVTYADHMVKHANLLVDLFGKKHSSGLCYETFASIFLMLGALTFIFIYQASTQNGRRRKRRRDFGFGQEEEEEGGSYAGLLGEVADLVIAGEKRTLIYH